MLQLLLTYRSHAINQGGGMALQDASDMAL